ncbi:class A beta-lactamase-related serine hydrolase [Kibdelosporangium philippinense]|uniref:Class A beta-lactamase-related serine hydrolase n=1 Tax=Kibdelosporangium philippinense TaxID=211113 RepID=A0ABS8ZM38_9PSEU|nr:serine hydrolase [Kibdelosporangium philippinense]MCE7008824.1 class A beta-lactamase-related serine hydrolase [Kibdelosporangium philippinense]
MGRRAFLSGYLVAAIVLVASAPAMSVTPADPAVAVLAAPRVTIEPSPEPEQSQEPLAQAPQATNIAAAMVDAASAAVPKGVTSGIAVMDLNTGQLATSGAGQFYTASLSKLMLVVDMLDRDVEITPTVQNLINRALGPSDDNAMNSLWVRFDGPNAMDRVAASLGMVDTHSPDDRSQWGEVVVSPAGYARLYQHIVTEMAPDDRDIILAALAAAPATAADGFNQGFGLLGEPFKPITKQGWMYYGNRLYLHSAGLVSYEQELFAVVLLTSQSPSANVARGNVTAMAQTAYRAMVSSTIPGTPGTEVSR